MENGKLTLGSLFDGIGGFPFAATIAGIKPIWAAEIEPFCVAITRHHFPDMEHLGSVTDINGAEIPPVDIITFGSPCQDLSVAGNRAGLDGERSGLFKEAVRIIYEMREVTNGKYPTFIVWENVPGAFNSNKGCDFRTVLEEITKTDIPMPESGKWAAAGVVRSAEINVAWRQLDAQYWGVPQRRKRIYLIGSFRSNSAEEILFECDSVRRYLTPRGTEREETAADIGRSVAVGCKCYDARGNGSGLIAPTMTGDHNNRITDYCTVVVQGVDLYNQCLTSDKCMTIRAAKSDCDHVPAVVLYSAGFLDRAPAEAYSIGYEEEKAPTLRAGMIPSTFCIQGNCIDRADTAGCNCAGWNKDVSYTLNTIDRHAVVYALDRASFNQSETAKYDFEISDAGINSTLVAKGPSAVAYKFIKWIVRRLTPLECERLQGYPDHWTELPKISDMTDKEYFFFLGVFLLDKKIRGKRVKKSPTKTALVKWYNKLDCDGSRYKALGNSLAIPCALRVIGGIADYISSQE